MPCGKGIKLPGGVYLEVGTPDTLSVVRGIPFLIESKKPTKKTPHPKPTAIQRRRLLEWHRAGAVVAVVYSKAEFLAIIDGDREMRRICAARAGIDLDEPAQVAPKWFGRGARERSTRP